MTIAQNAAACEMNLFGIQPSEFWVQLKAVFGLALRGLGLRFKLEGFG